MKGLCHPFRRAPWVCIPVWHPMSMTTCGQTILGVWSGSWDQTSSSQWQRISLNLECSPLLVISRDGLIPAYSWKLSWRFLWSFSGISLHGVYHHCVTLHITAHSQRIASTTGFNTSSLTLCACSLLYQCLLKALDHVIADGTPCEEQHLLLWCDLTLLNVVQPYSSLTDVMPSHTFMFGTEHNPGSHCAMRGMSPNQACCREEVPWQQRAANLSMCLNGIAECMATRYSYFSEHLWRSAVSAFITVVTVGVPAVNIAYVNNEQPPDSQVWSALSKAFER